MKTTADRIREGMQMRGVRQADLAEKTGISKGALSSYLSGRYVPKQNNTYLIAEALNVNEAWLMGADVPFDRNYKQSKVKKGVKIPVLGYVRAGVPIEAVEEIVDYEEITEAMASTGEFFGLKINGDSMEPRICKNDVVIVKQQSDAESGDLVIVLVNGSDATCKRLKKYSDGIALISNNPRYEPMIFSKEEVKNKPVTIIGKVVELRGKF